MSNSGFSGFFTRVASSVLENAMNSASPSGSSGTSAGVSSGRSFLSFRSVGTVDAGDRQSPSCQIVEYSGRATVNEIASLYPIVARCGDLIWHGPCKDASAANFALYNIILHGTNASSSTEKMYSVYRTDSESEASRMYIIYKQIFPDLVKASSSPLERQTIERIVKITEKHESYSAVHVAAALNMTEQLQSAIFRAKLEEQEPTLLHTPLHVAVVHGRLEAFRVISENSRVLTRVYDYQDFKGNTIIHLAAVCKDKGAAVAILRLLREKLMNQMQAASTKRRLLDLFQEANNEGLAPIHIACELSNVEVVEEITSACEDLSTGSCPESLLDLRVMSTGNTPLHLATSKPKLLAHLLELGSDPNIVDNKGLSPLHKAVLESYFESTLHLLASRAYPNLVVNWGPHVNASPLHIAAFRGDVLSIKALIVFGADLEMKDGFGHTPRHIVVCRFTGNNSLKQEALHALAAAGAKRCCPGVPGGCGEGCKAGGKENGKVPHGWKITKDGATTEERQNGVDGLVHEAMRGLSIFKESYEGIAHTGGAETVPVVGGRLLSLDGGGIRGLVLTQMLFFIEQQFCNISGGGEPIITFFDWVAGTSTGGIVALALACGKSVLETQCLYIKLKDKVFTGDRPYSAKRMEDFLKKEFGPERRMSSIQKPRVMIMTSLANRTPLDLYIFRNYMSPGTLVGQPEDHIQDPEDTYVWETAKVTGAAPSYFTLDNDVFIDGGLISNNPTLDAIAELVQFKSVMLSSQSSAATNATHAWKLPSIVLSLGTGQPPRAEVSARNLDIAWPTGVFDALKNVPRLQQLVNLLIDQATQAEGQVVERARAWCTSIGVPFFRFSPEMSADIDLDETRDEVLVNLMWETWCYMESHREALKEIYERLVNFDVSKKLGIANAMDTLMQT